MSTASVASTSFFLPWLEVGVVFEHHGGLHVVARFTCELYSSLFKQVAGLSMSEMGRRGFSSRILASWNFWAIEVE